MQISPTLSLINTVSQHRKIFLATTNIELKKRYAGSLFGSIWVFLYPLLFLSVYLFLYIGVFKIKYPEMDTYSTVLYIFTGLVPYIAFMESCNSSCTVIKQNLHFVKNILTPIELIPLRVVCMSMWTQSIGLVMMLVLAILAKSLSWHILLLPLALLIQFMFIAGLALNLSIIGFLLPDTAYFTSILTLLLLFISPIGFMAVMLSEKLQYIVYFNPIYYILQPFRFSFMGSVPINNADILIALVISAGIFISGCKVFYKLRGVIIDYE